MLAALSRRTGVHIVAATGLHHEKFYRPEHWSLRYSMDELADLFVADVGEGIDERDCGGPVIRRTEVKAGIVKGGGEERRSRAIGRSSGRPPQPTSELASRSHAL